jgi:hypothetical protein
MIMFNVTVQIIKLAKNMILAEIYRPWYYVDVCPEKSRKSDKSVSVEVMELMKYVKTS